MALPDEFEYLSKENTFQLQASHLTIPLPLPLSALGFRCAYCYALNPARKQKQDVSMVTHREPRQRPPSAAAPPAPAPPAPANREHEDEARDNGDSTLVDQLAERREDDGDVREEEREGEEREHDMADIPEERDERDVDNADQ